jgi:hypothetical protein
MSTIVQPRCGVKANVTTKRAIAPKTFLGARVSSVSNGSKVEMSRWKGMDEDISDDQQDITRGRGMVDSKFQGAAGLGGTHNATMSSTDYLSAGMKTYSQHDNITTENFYISPSFMDKMVVHIAKNYMELPKIKVPLILGVWGGKGQGKTFQSDLIFKKLGIAPIVMSAGELESGNAGEPPSSCVNVTVRRPTLSRRVRCPACSSTISTPAPVVWVVPPNTPLTTKWLTPRS